jgi:membrane fusion protein (multidrug efflux system)
MMQRIIIGACFGLMSLVACQSKKKEEPKSGGPGGGSGGPQPVQVDIILASKQSIQAPLEANGSVLADETAEIRPEISGRLTYLNMPDGAAVTKGALLGKIYDGDLQAQVKKVKVQLSLAETQEARLKKLLAINGINQSDYDIALNQVNVLKADLEILEAQIERTLIKAPFSGVLGLRMISPGAYVTPQTLMGTIQQIDKVKIDFTVPEDFGHLVKKGARVNVSTAEGKKGAATILATEPQISTTTRNIRARAYLEGIRPAPGSFVKVEITNAEAGKTYIVVPANAVIPDARSKKVIVVRDGKGVFTNVKTGVRTASGLAVTEGLQPGDSVIVTGVLFVRPNNPVKIRSVKQLEDLNQ